MTNISKVSTTIVLSAILIGTGFALTQYSKSAEAHHGGLIPISVHAFIWIDPDSGGRVRIVQEVFEGCSDGHPHEMTFQYVVTNGNYDPAGGNGFSGFNIIFNGPIPDFHNQISPSVGGPWVQNAFTVGPPFNAEWDAPTPGVGIKPRETGIFSFCTDEREDIIVNDPPLNPNNQGPNGWAHTWVPAGSPIPADQCDDIFIAGQTCLFNGPISIPGDLLPTPFVLGVTCDSDRHIICKKVKYFDKDRDGIIEVGEPVFFLEFIIVQNPSGGAWTQTTVEDRWGAEIDVLSVSQATAMLTQQGKSEKEFLEWDIGTLGPGQSTTLLIRAMTDLNPAGHQEYSECGEYEFNSGAVLKFLAPDGTLHSVESGGITVSVPCEP